MDTRAKILTTTFKAGILSLLITTQLKTVADNASNATLVPINTPSSDSTGIDLIINLKTLLHLNHRISANITRIEFTSDLNSHEDEHVCELDFENVQPQPGDQIVPFESSFLIFKSKNWLSQPIVRVRENEMLVQGLRLPPGLYSFKATSEGEQGKSLIVQEKKKLQLNAGENATFKIQEMSVWDQFLEAFDEHDGGKLTIFAVLLTALAAGDKKENRKLFF